MPSYKPYREAVSGFITGRNLAYSDKMRTREEEQFQKQQQQDETMKSRLTGMLLQEYPDSNPESLKGLSKDDLVEVAKAHVDKKKAADAQKQAEVKNAIDMMDKGFSAAKATKGKVSKYITQQTFVSALPILQKNGYLKGIDINELNKKLEVADDKVSADYIKEINDIAQARRADPKTGGQPAISDVEAKKLFEDITVEFMRNLEPEEQKAVTDYMKEKVKELEPPKEEMNDAALIKRSLAGDPTAKAILAEKQRMGVEVAGAKATAAIGAKLGTIDIAGTAQAVLDGRETIENVKNTFGVPIQETIRKEVLKQDPTFNFNQPRATAKSLESSLIQQQKNRGMMGSFVKNINSQVDKLEKISKDLVKRIGVRALDLPRRELLTRVVGSGQEQVMAAYMKEISAEIAKLAQGSAASIAQLPESNRQEWEKIHDVNLSIRELLIVLNGTREMANIRLGSVDDEIKITIDKLKNVRQSRGEQPSAPQSKFKILKVE